MYILILYFWKDTGKQKILDRMVAAICRFQSAVEFLHECSCDVLEFFLNI